MHSLSSKILIYNLFSYLYAHLLEALLAVEQLVCLWSVLSSPRAVILGLCHYYLTWLTQRQGLLCAKTDVSIKRQTLTAPASGLQNVFVYL